MLFLEQRLSARHVGRGVKLNARLLHGIEARGWRMKFGLLRAEVEIDARDPEVYRQIARRLSAANVHVRPLVPPQDVDNVTPKTGSNPLVSKSQPALLPSANQMKPLYCQDGGEMKVGTPCHSPGAILPDLPQATEDPEKNYGLSKDATSSETQAWLNNHRFSQHSPTFANFSGADLLRLSRDDIIQICGLADGIRLFNALHAKRIEPRLTVYVCTPSSAIYSAVYLHSCRAHELLAKLKTLLHSDIATKECDTVLVSGPHGARVRLSDELVRHLPDNSTYRVELVDSNALILSPTN